MPRHIFPTPFIIQPDADLVHRQPELKHASSKLSSQYADSQLVTDADLRSMGSALWNALPHNIQNGFDAAHQAAGAAILPIIIESEAAEVQALPWETLFHPTLGFIGKHPAFTLSRRMKPPQSGSVKLDKGPLRVLLFTSLPKDIDPEKSRLNVEEEQAQVQEALMPWISKGDIQLEMPDDGRFSTLKEMLKNFQPHVLFLSGHGSFHHAPHTGQKPFGVFIFENDSGSSDPVREDEIAKALVGTGVQAVVLSACESGKAASDALTNGLTQRISAQGIPHVIGMRESVLDQAGIQFARALCDELARHEPIDFALQSARIAIQTPLHEYLNVSRVEASASAAAEISLGQWPLPMLLSPDPQKALIDWDFQPKEIEAHIFKQSLRTVTLPARFVGRRDELRKYKRDLLNGKTHHLLITGPGGQGKTSLAGKLALDMQAHNYRIFAWSARPENPWRQFEFEMELSLEEANAKKYDYFKPRFENDKERAAFMLGLLMEQFNGRVILFLDNLETLQDEDTQVLKNPLVAAWMRAAKETQGLILLATSRWQLPDWAGEHLALSQANYGDFLQMAQGLASRKQLPISFLENRERLRRVYDVLGGNSRGLELFAAAVSGMERAEDEAAFLELLAKTKGKLQENMAIEEIYKRLPENAKKLLQRLPAFHEPVPAEGIIKLGLDLPNPESLLERLLAVSLIEAQYEPGWDAMQYQCPPLVTDWMAEQKLVDENPAWLNTAAEYQLYLLANERRTLPQAILTVGALRRAGRHDEADRLTLDHIVGHLTMRGLYATLLNEWLPPILNSQDLQTRAQALGQTGKLLIHLGSFKEAMPFLKQSLAIRQQIGDKAGLCATLFNMGHIYMQNKQVQEAVSAWVTVYGIAKQINEYQALQALSKLAPQLGLPEGLEGWEKLAGQMQSGQNQAEPKEESEQIKGFIQGLVQAVRAKSPEAQKYFESVSKMAVDPEAPPEYQALGKALQQFMSGVKRPDLSSLPEEMAKLVKEELEK